MKNSSLHSGCSFVQRSLLEHAIDLQIFNDGESLCVFNGKILLTMPTEQHLDGEQWSWRLPFTISIQRVMDRNEHSSLNKDTYYVNRK